MNNKNNKWTDEQTAFLLIKRQEGVKYEKIVSLMENKFGVKRNASSLAVRASSLKTKKVVTKKARKPIRWTQEKVDFVFSSLWNGLDSERIKMAFEEQFDYKLSNTQLKNCFAKQKASQEVQEKANEMLYDPKTIEVETKTPTFNPLKEDGVDWRQEPATRKQLRYLSRLENPECSNQEIKILTEGKQGNYTKSQANEKISKLLSLNGSTKKRTQSSNKLSEEVTVFVEKHGNPKTRHLSKKEKNMLNQVKEVLETVKPEVVDTLWTREQDYDLLCNFYELSIDEARNHFNQSYSVIAGRLESLFDSTEPEDIELLMKAAEEVSTRKKEEDRIRNMGYWKRRKLRKQAKRVAKLERKLNKMRGE